MGARLTGVERREAVLATSMRLFARKGFAGTTTKEIARAAGVSEAMVFKCFPTKESLYRALLERKVSESEAALPVRDLAASDAPPEEYLDRIARTYFERIEDDPAFLRLLLYSALEGHPLAHAFDRAHASARRRAVTSYLRRRMRDGTLRRADPAFAARSFVGLTLWFVLARTLFHDAWSRRMPHDRLVREIVKLWLDGMRPREER